MSIHNNIHIWHFPKTNTFININKELRCAIIDKAIKKFGNEAKLVKYINEKSIKYGINKKISRGAFYQWKKGHTIYKNNKKTRNPPLWVIIELSKVIANKTYKTLLSEIEKNTKYYCSTGGASRIYNPKLPIRISPELTSLIFHLMGDGHISSKPGVVSSYRQMNKVGLDNVHKKLNNCFGKFKTSQNQKKEGKLHIPKSITNIIKHHFSIEKSDWHNAYIPKNVKKLPKKYLVAGLVAFIIDEGNIGEVIEIYSKNYELLKDIREIALKCEYECRSIRKKYRYGLFDSYRFLISSDSYMRLYEDVRQLEATHNQCGFAHKTNNFMLLVRRKKKDSLTSKKDVTKRKILHLVRKKEKTIYELSEILCLTQSTIREHLWKLERDKKIIRVGNKGRNILWSTKQNR